MGVFAGPDIVESGLVLALDAGNLKSYREDKNIINPKTWVSGTTGGQTGFGANGSTSENSLITGTDPFGNTAVLWEAIPLGDNNADGGWNTGYFPIDHTKKYRYSVWVNRTVLGTDGRFYLGLNGYDSSLSNVGVLIRSSGNNSTNPYFEVSSAPPSSQELPVGEWVLVVGHVWPSGSGVGSNYDDTGIYKIDGTKLSATVIDYVWNTTVTQSAHRSYLFYTTDTTVRQRWVYPRVDLCDGTEPSIGDLLNNKVNNLYVYDSIKNNNGTLVNGVGYSGDNLGSLSFDGVDDYINLTKSFIGSNEIQTTTSSYTLEAWINVRSSSGTNVDAASIIGNAGNYGVGMQVGISNGKPRMNYGARFTNNFYGSEFSYNTWTHVCLSRIDGQSVKAYLNGNLDVSFSSTELSVPSGQTYENMRIGNGAARVTGFYDGYISVVRIYNRGLTDNEIQQNYNATKSRYL